ncbi:MAG: hypothetical protein ABI134_25195 [Byssovorax sp.]
MAWDLERLGSYVRFYLTVKTQLGSAWENLDRAHAAVKDALAPFAESLAPVEATALTEAMKSAPVYRDRVAELWSPEDLDRLSELTDVYEVVGRFSFQGEDNKNLAKVQALVSGARNEIVNQRGRVADLLRLPGLGRAAAARLAAQEEARAAADLRDKTATFEPLAEAVVVRARQTIEATRAVPIPDLSSADTASDEYKRYAVKLDHVYQTCVPFLRKAISSLYGFVGCEPTATWPDALPLERELPAELCSVPSADSPDWQHARTGLKQLAEEEIQLGRARDEITTAAARIEGEMAAAAMKDKEIELEIAAATALVDYVFASEQAEGARQAVPALEQQRALRLHSGGEVAQRHRAVEETITLLEDELRARTEEITALDARLEAERKSEPVLFGKDEWRGRVAAFEAELEARRGAWAQRKTALNQHKIELSALSVQVQTEQAQSGLIERQVESMQARLATLTKTLREMEAVLGSARPARAVPLSDAQSALATLQQGKIDLAQRVERLKAETRRQKEEAVRVLGRMKQLSVERQQMSAMLQNAEVSATQGHEAALKQLAAQRRAAVERHVSEVLGTLEKSLTLVGQVFIDPAREALTKSCAPRTEIASAVLENAEKIAPLVEKLHLELEPELLAQDATLGQLQREFCDVALNACRTAWL